MSKKKMTKEEVKQPDAFMTFSEKMIQMVEDNAPVFVIVFALFLVAGGGYAVFDLYKKSSEESSQEAFFEANHWLEQQQDKIREAHLEKIAQTGGDKKSNEEVVLDTEKTPENLAKDFPGIDEKFKAVIASHNGRSGSISAAMTLSKVYTEYKSNDKALAALESVNSVSKASVFYPLFHLRKGELYMTQDKWQPAIESFQKVIDHKESKFAHPAALLKQGLAYEKNGDADSAEGAYERIISDYKNSNIVESARVYLKLLKFQKNR